MARHKYLFITFSFCSQLLTLSPLVAHMENVRELTLSLAVRVLILTELNASLNYSSKFAIF